MSIQWGVAAKSNPTVEGEVAKHCRNKVKQEAEANTDVGYILHPAFSGSERHKDTLAEHHVNVYNKAEKL